MAAADRGRVAGRDDEEAAPRARRAAGSSVRAADGAGAAQADRLVDVDTRFGIEQA